MKSLLALLGAWARGFHLGYALLALLLAVVLWGIAHNEAPLEHAYELPVVTRAAPPHLVVVRQDFESVNIRVRARRALLASIDERALLYEVDFSNAEPGPVRKNVDASRIASRLPPGAEVVSSFPSSLTFELELKQTRAVRVRPELRGDPAPGFRIFAVHATPARVSLTGAQSEISGLRSIGTEPVDIAGARESLRRPVRLPTAERNGWLETFEQVEVHVEIAPQRDGDAAPQSLTP